MTQLNSDSYRNPLRYQGQDYTYVPLYYRQRSPTTTDIRPKEQTGYYLIGSQWVDTSNGELWFLASFTTVASVLQANWELLASTGFNPVLQFTVDTGTNPVTPTDSGNVTITSSDGTISVNGSTADTIDLTAGTPLLKPAFSAYVSAAQTGVTGAGGFNYTILFDTKNFDQLTNYTTGSGIFTAPFDGIYFFTWEIYFSGLTVAHNSLLVFLTTGGQVVYSSYLNPSSLNNAGLYIHTGSALVSMIVGQQAFVNVQVAGSTQTVNVEGGGLATGTSYFAGYLVC